MRMLVALVDLQLGAHGAANLVLGQHALDGQLDYLLGTAVAALVERLAAQPAGDCLLYTSRCV